MSNPESRDTSVGEVLVSRWHDPMTRQDKVRIDRADPKARISVELVAQIRDVRSKWATCTESGVLTLSDDFGQRFIYRIDWDSFDVNDQSFSMEWPD